MYEHCSRVLVLIAVELEFVTCVCHCIFFEEERLFFIALFLVKLTDLISTNSRFFLRIRTWCGKGEK
ncbi:unnamed protein product [Lasius platythorax]|uniref:Secreted protein n=1 Tax=Lasius platythorax TaxID=488582 RepID=A0AAV2NQC5_9HYME